MNQGAVQGALFPRTDILTCTTVTANVTSMSATQPCPSKKHSHESLVAGCIALQILLLDAVPSIGIRSYLKFLTFYTPQMLRAVDAVLRQARERVAAQQPPCYTAPNFRAGDKETSGYLAIPIVAAQHHPMSVLQFPGTCANRGYRGRLQSLLAHHHVQVLVSGHLHEDFGARQHVCHHIAEHERLRDLSSNSNSNSAIGRVNAADSATLMTSSAPVHTTRRCMLELEAPGWHSSRHFRLMTFSGGALSFTDARMETLRCNEGGNGPIPHGEVSESNAHYRTACSEMIPTGVTFISPRERRSSRLGDMAMIVALYCPERNRNPLETT